MRLISVADGAVTTTYAYNGDGDRVAQEVDGVRTEYVLDTAVSLTMVLAETTGTGTIYYLHGLGLVAQSDGVSTEYFVNDGLGSVRQLVDPVGEVLLAQTYDPYGSLYASAGVDSTAFGYAGEQEDANGLVFLRARYYSPSTGRFLNMDPSRQEMNPYQYATSNPVMFIDPTGLQSQPPVACSTLTGAEKYRCLYNIKGYLNDLAKFGHLAGIFLPGLGQAAHLLDHYLYGSGNDLTIWWDKLSPDVKNGVHARVREEILSYAKNDKDFLEWLSDDCPSTNSVLIDISFNETYRTQAYGSTQKIWHILADVVTGTLDWESGKKYVKGESGYFDPYYVGTGGGVNIATLGKSLAGQSSETTKLLTVFTPVEVADHYGWCPGFEECTASYQHPFARAGHFFALEYTGMANQFTWYSVGLVVSFFEVLPGGGLQHLSTKSISETSGAYYFEYLGIDTKKRLKTYEDDALPPTDASWNPTWDNQFRP